MDLAYLRAHPDQLPTFRTHQRIRETPVGGGSISSAIRLTLDDGNSLFAKEWPDRANDTAPGAAPMASRPDGFFEAEAAGLEWLRVDDGAPLPKVVIAVPDLLALEWIEAGEPTEAAARSFGAALARTHRAGASHFGAQWAGFIGTLPLDNAADDQPWSSWFGYRRLWPYLRMCRDRGALGPADVSAVERLIENIAGYAGEADVEPPARIHGDLWPGNLMWASRETVYLIDPAAHGGHRETDLANLSLFGGTPYRSEIIAGYQQEWPLSSGWLTRVPLHQLFLLLVHAAMFGAGYRAAILSAVRATVEA